MKKIKNFKYAAILGCLTLGTTLTSCTDWLTLYPMDKIVEENFWEDKRDLESVRYAAYTNMISSACMQRYLIWGELRSDNFRENDGALSNELQEIMNVNLKPSNSSFDWSSFYSTINYCNKVLQHGPEILQKDKSFSLAEWEGIRAEMIALRALNYFYLIRTFDAVPMVFTAINDDNEVRALEATPQDVLMDSLISQMEFVTTTEMTSNFGNSVDNKGLITDKAVHTILADLYLWRGSYYESTDKVKADSNYQACVAHCDTVLRLMDKEYQNSNTGSSNYPSMGGGATSSENNNPYHFILNKGTETSGLGSKTNAYNAIFGETENSSESIFELQMDGTTNVNTILSTYYRPVGSNPPLLPTDYISLFSSSADDDTNAKLFSKTDLRRFFSVQPIDDTKYYIAKYAASSINQFALTDNSQLTDRTQPQYSIRSTPSANWIFYRLSDVLLMKAEALCMIGTDLQGAFELVKAVNERSNPYATEEQKLPASIATSKEKLEGLILRERNREFFGEGKRWFDLVRYAMRKGEKDGPSKAFEIFGVTLETLVSSASKKYKQSMKVMYSPYWETEMKANPKLVQNPIWDDQSTIQKK